MNALQTSGTDSDAGGPRRRGARWPRPGLWGPVIILGPLAYGTEPGFQASMEGFLSPVTGGQPQADQRMEV
jgi:hypothetical protein